MATLSPDMIVDKDEQLEKVQDFCLPSETIRAVFDLKGGGTGFIGITDKRVIYYDMAFFSKKKAMVSIPFSRIVSVASEDDKGTLIKAGFFVKDTLLIQGMGMEMKAFEFRGGDKAHKAHELIMESILD